jgi:hypothetical protein
MVNEAVASRRRGIAAAWPKEGLAAASQLSRSRKARVDKVYRRRRLLLCKTRPLALNVHFNRWPAGALAALWGNRAGAKVGVVY